MKQIKIMLLALTSVVLVGCGTSSTVPITGRTQRLLVSDAEINSMALQQYQQTISQSKLSTNAANTAIYDLSGRRGTNPTNGIYITQRKINLGSK